MKRIAPFLTGVVCAAIAVLSPTAQGNTESFWDEAGIPSRTPALSVASTSPELTEIRLVDPQIVMLDSVVEMERYQAAYLPGEPFYYVEGAPAVPHITRFYRIPNLGGVSIETDNMEWEDGPRINPLPYNEQREGEAHTLLKSPAIYMRNQWYPPEPVVVSSPMIFRDFRLVTVTIFPVQVNPITGETRICRNLAVNLVSDPGAPAENELVHPRRPSRAFAPLYRDMIANLDEGALDDITENPGTYLILCRNQTSVTQWADSLALWKRRMGYDVVIDSRSNWSTSQMYSAISDMYDEQDLEFVCIMGDATGAVSMPTSGSEYDHYFADVTGDDLEDIGIGRLPGQSSSQFNLMFNKIAAYERDPSMADPAWFHRAFLYAGTGYSVSSNEILMIWARRQFQTYTGISTINISTHSGNVNNQLIAQRLNEGVTYFLWRGTVVGEMDGSAANGTNNGTKLPVVLTITCGTGSFNEGAPCISESWILAGTPQAMKGGVCGIGTATYGTHVQYNNTVAGGLVYSICNLGLEHLGLALAGAKAQLYTAFPNDGYAINFVHWNNLMGEPSLSLWTDEPLVVNATYPGTINVGARRVQVQVTRNDNGNPVQDALVVVLKDGEVSERALTDEFGFTDLPVRVNSPGTMTLTVSKHNMKPFLADIACVDAPEMVTLLGQTLDDDNVDGTSGNGDGEMNPGEIIDLLIKLRNFGLADTARQVTAVLTSSNDHVVVTADTVAYPDIAPGDSALPASSFRISVSPMMKHAERVLLTVAVTTEVQTYHSTLRLICAGGDAVYETQQVIGGDGDGWLEPAETAGLRVTVRNVGDIALNNISGTIISRSSFVNVGTPTLSFGTIPAGGTATSSGNGYTLTGNPLAYPGYPAQLLLVLSNTSGFTDSISFVVPLGTPSSTDPTGPDAYGYYAYDNTDTDYEQSRPFDYIQISSIGTDLDLNDPGEQSPNGPTYAVARTLPFPFTFYGEEYNAITICSNGWAAFGEQADQDQFRNYPIPGQQAPEAMIAPLWDDLATYASNKGVWDYFDAANHRYIIQWKANCLDNVAEDFEIILLDEEYYPTRDGNGIVVVQYQQVSDCYGSSDENDIHYATVGIEAPGSLVGLEYRFNNIADPGAATLAAGRAITFTTEARVAFGDITGVVVDAATMQPVEDAAVTIDGEVYWDSTDAQGHYSLNDVEIGTYAIRVRKHGFNDGTAEGIVVLQDSTTNLNFSLLHPEIALSVEQINVSLPDDPSESYFQLINNGNGPLDYSVAVEFTGNTGSLDDDWTYVSGFDVSAATGDQLIQGCELAGNSWWISGSGLDLQHRIYHFDLDGNYLGSLAQPEGSGPGWFDMAWDGTLLYGSSGPNLVGVDLTGTVQDTIQTPLNPARAVAYDPHADHFWVADYSTDIYEISRSGEVVSQIPAGIHITGLAWNATDDLGYKLCAFGHDTSSRHALVYRIHPISGQMQFVGDLGRQNGDRAGGCVITAGWNSALVVFAGILQNSSNDRLGIWQIDFNTSWIAVTPMIGSVAGGTSREIEVRFDPSTLRDDVYSVNLVFNNNTAGGTIRLPVTLTVTLDAGEAGPLVADYRLEQNYPNPFNPVTTIRYNLRQTGMARLQVFDVLGRLVAEPVREVQNAGAHRVTLDLAGMPSGVYLYRLESGSFTATRKLLLLK